MFRWVGLLSLVLLCLANAPAIADSHLNYGSVVSTCGDDHPRLEFRRTGLSSFNIVVFNSHSTDDMESALSNIVRNFNFVYSSGCHVSTNKTVHIFSVYRLLEEDTQTRGFYYFPTDVRVA